MAWILFLSQETKLLGAGVPMYDNEDNYSYFNGLINKYHFIPWNENIANNSLLFKRTSLSCASYRSHERTSCD